MTLRKRRPGLVYPVNEDWHYVGETSEPAFGTDWANAAADRNLAFRKREAGAVDVQGFVENTNAPSAPGTETVFVLPVGYRPTARATYITAGLTATAGQLVPVQIRVETSGDVKVMDAMVSPYPAPGVSTVIDAVWLNGEFYLNPSDAP
jgi:hypothetical protein